MPRRFRHSLFALLAMLFAAPAPAQDDPGAAGARPEFRQDSLNVFRRFPAEDRQKMVDFYEKVLALEPLQPIQLNATTQIILFHVGRTGQIKLAAGLQEGRRYHPGGIAEATGIRLYTLRYPDEATLAARFTANGHAAPRFTDIGEGRKAALVRDPAGFTLQLIVEPGASPQTNGVEVGINVSDLDRSRAFYRDFAGLEELPPVEDAFLGVTRYPFRHGETIINLWSAGHDLPADTGSAGIQYVTGNVREIDAAAKARNITVETPLAGVPGFNIMTVWLNDPDGVTNYFYQMLD